MFNEIWKIALILWASIGIVWTAKDMITFAIKRKKGN